MTDQQPIRKRVGRDSAAVESLNPAQRVWRLRQQMHKLGIVAKDEPVVPYRKIVGRGRNAG